jgi:hypothetical protein
VKLACFIFLLSLSAPFSAQQANLAGRSVGMTLIKADDLSPLAWPATQIELKTVSATSTADQNVYMMLQANGIAPDSQAFTVVYDLNPSVTDLDSLPPNSVLQLPVVTGGEQLKSLLRNGDLVRLTVDPEIRQQISQLAQSLQGFAPSVSQLSSDAQTQTELKDLIAWYGQVDKRFRRRTDPPLRHETLLEMRDEADVLEKILAKAHQQQRQLTDNEKGQINAIHDDMKIEIDQYGETLAGNTPKAQSSYSVTVNIKGADPKSLENLRVYYTFNGLFRPLPAQPQIPFYGFRNTGSGQSDNLLRKNYEIWAARDGDANHPVTPPYLLRIDDTAVSPLSVDLSLTGVPPK